MLCKLKICDAGGGEKLKGGVSEGAEILIYGVGPCDGDASAK